MSYATSRSVDIRGIITSSAKLTELPAARQLCDYSTEVKV
jgi:hypothetical protein